VVIRRNCFLKKSLVYVHCLKHHMHALVWILVKVTVFANLNGDPVEISCRTILGHAQSEKNNFEIFRTFSIFHESFITQFFEFGIYFIPTCADELN
jgi:hypothetical protein